ncbi:uncharacterized protein LOC135685354 [Rhopilema esculentum]|uniref:uncharacterized protein LOC135685354 n=1 Tax=Rhopilema esculentum TaxID=499914 RepID=UPI0031DDC598
MKWIIIFVILKFDQLVSLYQGVRLGDFPAPDFRTTIREFPAQSKKLSFRRISLPAYFKSTPDLVRVFASTQDGDSAGFRFEGAGACQNPGKAGNYGGLIFAYNGKYVYIWAPTKYSGNRNGKLIYVEDGWGGEKYTQSSRIADVTVEVWKNLPTPNFQTEIQVDGSKLFYEVPHKLKQIPDFISVRVFARKLNSFDKRYLFHFPAVGASQTPKGSTEYGGVIYSYNETFVRLWLPNNGENLKTGCIKITGGWGNGRHADDVNADVCQVEIRAWINSFPLPAFQTGWRNILANAHQKSFREIHHNLGVDTLLVQVHVKKPGIETNGFIYEALGSVQSTQSDGDLYGGILFAYDKSRVRIWVASSETDRNGRAIFVSDAWGNGTHTEKLEKVLFRIKIFAHLCKKNTQIADGQGICRDAENTGLVWQTSSWNNCSSKCGIGSKLKKLTGCHALKMRTVVSCDFEDSMCGFTSSNKWQRSRGSAETKINVSGFMQPPYGYRKGTYFVYPVMSGLHPGSRAQLRSPPIANGKKCNLKFYWNTGVYYNYFEVLVRVGGIWKIAWKMSDKQPGNPYIWYAGYLNLERVTVEQFSFSVKVGDHCRRHCGYVAFDDVTLSCEAENRHMVSLQTCELRALALPGCPVNILEPIDKGPAYSVVIINRQKYIRANGTVSQTVASYQFRVEKNDFYTIWIDFLGTNSTDNSISYVVDHGRIIPRHLSIRKDIPVWSCLNPQGVFLKSGVHTLTFRQYKLGFRYREIRVTPKHLSSWSSLGMQNLHINDNQLSSSLKLDMLYKNAPHLRLNGLGAWVTNDLNFDWLHWQVRFPDLALVNKIAIQGGCNLKEPACCSSQSVKLKFSVDGLYFSYYRNLSGGIHSFHGSYNSAPHFAVESSLEYAVPARAIRFYPFNHRLLTCVRVEIYGSYLTRAMCANTGVKPMTMKRCVGDRNCGENAECSKHESATDEESCHCSPGFHGPSCQNMNCQPNPCQNGGTCKAHLGMFECLCKPGYMGRLCQMSCPSNKYGPGCNETCACIGKSRCHPLTGECVCERGYTGKQCDQRCPKRLYGVNCKSICKCSPVTNCDPAFGGCYCPPGLFGESCKEPCLEGYFGRNCTSRCECTRRSQCLPENGTCICPPGWTGRFCEKECPDGKYGANCSKHCSCPVHALCNKHDGSCMCTAGWVGHGCDKKCMNGFYGVGCKLQCDCSWKKTEYCHHVTGQCVCKAGYVGTRCENRCKPNKYGPGCKELCKCKNGATCNPKDGSCRCPNGYIGKFCERPCPTGRYGRNCVGVCKCIGNQTEACDIVDGSCDCIAGYKGNVCRQTCQTGWWGKNCVSLCYCNHGADCDPSNGFCACTSGWEGEYCDSSCDNLFYGPGCKHRCRCHNGATCDRFNGSCSCALGFYGQYCEAKCPSWWYGKDCAGRCTCIKNNAYGCSNSNGTCFCREGYQGNNCQKECDDGKYGGGCQLDCPVCRYHVVGPCDKTSGQCNCSIGYYGTSCESYCPLERYGRYCAFTCNCTVQEICSHVNGGCLNRNEFEFFVSLRLGYSNSLGYHLRKQLIFNIERLMAKYFHEFFRPISVRRRDLPSDLMELTTPEIAKLVSDSDGLYTLSDYVTDSDGRSRDGEGIHVASVSSAEKDMPDRIKDFVGQLSPEEFEHKIVRRNAKNNSKIVNCEQLDMNVNLNSFSVRITSASKKFAKNGQVVFKIGFVALYKEKPQPKERMDEFLNYLPETCLLTGANCESCAFYAGKLFDNEPEPSSSSMWIIIGASLGGAGLLITLAICLIARRRRQNIVPTIYKVKKNSRDIELRPFLANGDGSHVLAFENPYYDVIAAMGLDDDIEEDYFNPLYTYDDVSLYCDDQGSDSGTETNNDEGYHYPYDRDSGISSGTIHQ